MQVQVLFPAPAIKLGNIEFLGFLHALKWQFDHSFDHNSICRCTFMLHFQRLFVPHLLLNGGLHEGRGVVLHVLGDVGIHVHCECGGVVAQRL